MKPPKRKYSRKTNLTAYSNFSVACKWEAWQNSKPLNRIDSDYEGNAFKIMLGRLQIIKNQ